MALLLSRQGLPILEAAPEGVARGAYVHSEAEGGFFSSSTSVKVDGEKVVDRGTELPGGTYVVQVGKRRVARVVVG